MLVQSTEDEGATSDRPFKPQPTPSSPHLQSSSRNHGGQSSSDKSLSGNEGDMTLQSVYDLCIFLCTQVTYQAKEIKHLKAQLKKQAKPVITHHKAWMKSIYLKQRLAGKKTLKANWMQKESVSKQGRKSAKAEPSVHKDQLFDELDDDEIDNMDTEDAQDVERTREVVDEEKEGTKDAVSTEDVVSTDKEKVSTDRSKDSTDKEEEGTDKDKDSTVSLDEGTDDRTEARSATPITSTTTPTMFGDDETIAQVLLNMSQAKAVSREKEKGVELKDVEETERPRPTSTRSLLTLKPLPKIDPKDKGKKKIEEEDESDTESEDIPKAEKKFKQLARDEEMARKLQEDWETEEERKRLAEEEATKTALSDEYDFIQARIEADRLLALRLQDEEREQFTVEERAKFLHDTIAAQRRFLAEQRAIAIKKNLLQELKIQALYEKVKRFDESFTAVGSTEDERRIKEMNEGKRKAWSYEDDSIARKRKRPQPDVDSDDEHRKCLKIVTFEGTIDSEIMEIKSFISKLDKGDLKIMMESSIEDNDQSDFWSDQQDWKIVTWRLYEACRVYILELEDGTIIHMLVERRYPLSKDLLQRMLDLGLEVEREVLNSPCFMVKSWLVQDQTVLGKDYSNLLIADSLLKTIWFINAPCYDNEALASPKANELTIPEQTATGKGTSNPFMAGSLPKTTKPT
ncbi:hypothetical protein Tco_0635897 [Tanacetum coccineum]